MTIQAHAAVCQLSAASSARLGVRHGGGGGCCDGRIRCIGQLQAGMTQHQITQRHGQRGRQASRQDCRQARTSWRLVLLGLERRTLCLHRCHTASRRPWPALPNPAQSKTIPASPAPHPTPQQAHIVVFAVGCLGNLLRKAGGHKLVLCRETERGGGAGWGGARGGGVWAARRRGSTGEE